MQTHALAAELEAARRRKESATPKSDAWYDADSEIERISRTMYAGRSVNVERAMDDAEREEER